MTENLKIANWGEEGLVPASTPVPATSCPPSESIHEKKRLNKRVRVGFPTRMDQTLHLWLPKKILRAVISHLQVLRMLWTPLPPPTCSEPQRAGHTKSCPGAGKDLGGLGARPWAFSLPAESDLKLFCLLQNRLFTHHSLSPLW